MIDSRPGERTLVLSEDECRRRLLRATIGYLAITTRALPFLLPVTIALIGGDLLLEPLLGSHTELAVDSIVALAVGGLTGEAPWSVTAQGVLLTPRPELVSLITSERPASRYLLQAEVLTGWERTQA